MLVDLMFGTIIINGERFVGLNFRVFHGFPEYRERVSVNISASLY